MEAYHNELGTSMEQISLFMTDVSSMTKNLILNQKTGHFLTEIALRKFWEIYGGITSEEMHGRILSSIMVPHSHQL